MGIDARIARIAARQHGAVSRAQAFRAGATRRMIGHRLATGRLEVVLPSVYLIAGTPRTFRLEVMAACLASGGVASHRAAGALWSIDGVAEGAVEVSAPRRVRIRGLRATEVHDLAPRDVTTVGPIPVTSVARTIVDVAARLDPEALEVALDDALRRRLVTPARLRETFDRLHYPGRTGAGALRSLLEARPSLGSVPDSPLETRMLRLLRRARLPEPVLHHRVTEGSRTVAIIDLAYPRHNVAIELDGYRYHQGRRPWQRDMRRMNVLILLGWRVLRFTDEDVRTRSHEVVRSVASALRSSDRRSSTDRVPERR